jgi:hypothetical protein
MSKPESAESRIVTARRNKIASRNPNQLSGRRLVTAITARSSHVIADVPRG